MSQNELNEKVARWRVVKQRLFVLYLLDHMI